MMQASVKSLVVFILVVIPLRAQAQIPELPGYDELLSNQTVVAQGLQQAQFENLEEVIPSPASEAAPFSASEIDTEPADLTIESPPVAGESIATPPPQPDDVAADVGLTQTYDIPVADVIPGEVADVFSTNNWFRGGRWYSKQEVLMLLRANLPGVHVAVDASEQPFTFTDTGAVVPTEPLSPFTLKSMNTKDADFTFEAGTRLTLGRILGRDVANRDHAIEFNFLGLFDYTGRALIVPTNPGNPASPGLSGIVSLLGSKEVNALIDGNLGFPIVSRVAGFDDSLSQEILYESDLNSFELNYSIGARPARDRLVLQPDGRWQRHATPSGLRSLFAGFRYISQDESFRYTSAGALKSITVGFDDQGREITQVIAIDEGGDYRVITDNDLFGIQLGGEAIQKRTNWVLGVSGKVGGLINFADRHSSLLTVVDVGGSNNVVLNTQSSSETLKDETLTFLGEAGAYLAYYVRPNTSFRLGYNVLYMNGLATAPGNVGLTGTFPRFELTGNALYHGLNLGFEMTW